MDGAKATRLVEFADQASRGLDALDARAWRDRIEAKYEDLTIAYNWLIDNGRADDAVRMAVALETYWMAAGRLAEGRAWLARGLAAARLSEASRANALHTVGMLEFWQGDDAASRLSHGQSRGIAKRIGEASMEALALAGLARLALRDGQLDEARSLCKGALRLTDESTYSRARSSALHVLSVAAQMRGDLEDAREKMTQRMELERSVGSLRLVAAECSNLSGVERQLGNLATARELALHALKIWMQQEDLWAIPYGLNQLAALAIESVQMVRGAILLAAAARMVDEQGAGWPPDEAPVFEASTTAARAALDEETFDTNWSRGATMTWREAAEYALEGGGEAGVQ
jgi:tetratricopeptide (TPR) repeat protein